MKTHAQPLRQNQLYNLVARPWASRLIATIGIVVMTIGLYVPVAGREVLFHSDSISHSTETWAISDSLGATLTWLHLERMPISVQLGIEAMYIVLALGGLALIPQLWQSLSSRGTAVVRWIYTIWLVLLVTFAVVGLSAWWQFMTQPPSELPAPSQPITITAAYILPGVAVFPLGVLFSCIALVLMLRDPVSVSPPAAPRTRLQRTAALVLTAGVLVWVIGFYLMPEAVTAACPPITFSVTQFVHGACAGIDSDQVLQAALYYAGLNPIALMLFTLGRNFELLVAVGCITALGGWTRQLSVATLAWLAAWPLLAIGVALVALQGAGVIAQHGFNLTATSSNWRVGPGMVVTFVGIALVALGQLGLWREMVRRKI